MLAASTGKCASPIRAQLRRDEIRLVVADDHRVLAQCIHRLDDGAPLGLGRDQRVPDRVAGVEKQDSRWPDRHSHLLNARRQPIEAAHRPAGKVALPANPRRQVPVEVVGVQDRDVPRYRRSDRRRIAGCAREPAEQQRQHCGDAPLHDRGDRITCRQAFEVRGDAKDARAVECGGRVR